MDKPTHMCVTTIKILQGTVSFIIIKHKLIESSRFTCISDNATNYENTSLSGEETDMFCWMSFLLHKAGQAKQS